MPEESTQVESPAAEDTSAPANEAEDNAALEAINSGGGVDAALKAIANLGKTAKPDPESASTEAAAPAAAGTTPDPASGQPSTPNLTPEQQDLLRRFHLTEKVVPANAAEREAFLANLKQRHDDQARLFREHQELQKRLQAFEKQAPAPVTATAPPTQATQPPRPETATPREIEEYQKFLADSFDADYATKWRAQFDWQQKQIDERVSPLSRQYEELKQRNDAMNQQAEQFGQMLMQLHMDQGLEDVRKVVPDIDLDENTPKGQANLAKLGEEARKLLEANYDPRKFNLRHALAKASHSVFSTEIQLAERKKLARSQESALRGGATRSGTAARSKPTETINDEDDKILAGIDEGKPVNELARFVSRRG